MFPSSAPPFSASGDTPSTEHVSVFVRVFVSVFLSVFVSVFVSVQEQERLQECVRPEVG